MTALSPKADTKKATVSAFAGNFISAANSLNDETDQCLKALPKVLLKAGNGNADIADLALRQLMEAAQDS